MKLKMNDDSGETRRHPAVDGGREGVTAGAAQLAFRGPLSPSAVARWAGLHPATVTGILDRLQGGGWVVRERDLEAPDRRAVTVRTVPGRNAELFRLYSGMSTSLDRICAGYTKTELDLSAGLLRRAAAAGRDATDELAGG
jgi:DNA-binding MarR family transcriptional regulator